MPFYIRKSISAGPFRFNLSKSGLGLSVGIKGLRLGLVGPRGHYIHAGRGGLYYRASLNPAAPRRQPLDPKVQEPQLEKREQYSDAAVQMIEIESGDVLEMRDERFQELLDEIKAKQSQIRYEVLFGCGMVGLGLATVFLIGQTGLPILALSVPAWGAGRWLDSYKRRSVLFYELDDEATKAYEAMTHAFDDMMRCSGKWYLQASGVVRDLNTWKHSAGATQIVSSKATTLAYSVPKIIATNITPPSIQAGRQTVHFFPDAAFVVQGNKVGASAMAIWMCSGNHRHLSRSERFLQMQKSFGTLGDIRTKEGDPIGGSATIIRFQCAFMRRHTLQVKMALMS